MMFHEIDNLKELTHRLHPMYRGQVDIAAPVIGALEVEAYLEPQIVPPAPSPVSAHLTSLRFLVWKNVARHLNRHRRQGIQSMGKSQFESWSDRIDQMCMNRHLLLAFAVPLFMENQMNSISAHPAQDVLLRLLKPIVESDAPIQDSVLESKDPIKGGNAFISAILHAGRVPFTVTCHDRNTLSRWSTELEAATVLLLPQVALQVEMYLPDDAKALMKSALREEVRSWQARRPTVGDLRQWTWLPNLI